MNENKLKLFVSALQTLLQRKELRCVELFNDYERVSLTPNSSIPFITEFASKEFTSIKISSFNTENNITVRVCDIVDFRVKKTVLVLSLNVAVKGCNFSSHGFSYRLSLKEG